MHKIKLTKPDGRNLLLYSRRPISTEIQAPSPNDKPLSAKPQLRWHPLRGEWVGYASHRQERTFLPPPEYNPLEPTKNPSAPTEVPQGDYDVAVFENLFPSLTVAAPQAENLIVPTRPGAGVCEVIVFTQNSRGTLGQLPLDHLELLIDVWADRYRELGERAEIQYVLPFENRGVEVGVTLHHPHGQLYAYPFVPPVPQKELVEQLKYYEQNKRGLLEDLIQNELHDKKRVVAESENVVAFVPVCARYAYEVWIAPKAPRPSLVDFTAPEKKDFARILKTVLLKYDKLWNKPFPYLMVFHQAPTDGKDHPEAHFHVEFYPPARAPGKLKYLAGTELGGGLFMNDCIPEEKAAELRAVSVEI